MRSYTIHPIENELLCEDYARATRGLRLKYARTKSRMGQLVPNRHNFSAPRSSIFVYCKVLQHLMA